MSLTKRLDKLEAEFSGETDTSRSILELLIVEDEDDAELQGLSPRRRRELDRLARLICRDEQDGQP